MKAELKAFAVMAMAIVGLVVGLDIEESFRGGAIGLLSGTLIGWTVLTFANIASFRDSIVGWFTTKKPPLWMRFLNVLSVATGCMVLYWSWEWVTKLVPRLQTDGPMVLWAIILSLASLLPSFMGFGMFLAIKDKWWPQPEKKQEKKVDAGAPASDDDWWIVRIVVIITAFLSPLALAVSLIVIPVGIIVFIPDMTKWFLGVIHADKRLQFIAYSCGGVAVAKVTGSPAPMLAVCITGGLVGILIHRYLYRPTRSPSVS
jgi:hypothetical protein